MRLLALHTLGHDTSVCVFNDGVLEFACESERASRTVHDPDVTHALQELWRVSGLAPSDIDHLAFTWPFLHALVRIEDALPMAQHMQAGRLHVASTSHLLDRPLPCTVVLHEAAHAALGAHYADWADDTVVVVNEGWGAFSQNSVFKYAAGALRLLELDTLPWFGTGFGWTTISSLLGVGDLPSSPGKTMAIGGYGTWSDEAAELICRAQPTYTPSTTGWRFDHTTAIESFLDAHPRFDDRAAFVHTFQALFSQVVTEHGARVLQRYGGRALSLSGGCALNLHANSALRSRLDTPLAIPPNCNDSGQAIGAALYCLHFVWGIQPLPFSVHSGGAPVDSAEGAHALRAAGWRLQDFDPDVLAHRLARGQILALAQGRSELGPRALGNRSLLASASMPGIRKRVSEHLKGREWYRPLGCVIAGDDFAHVFHGQRDSPHMLFSYAMPPALADEARHADGSSRVQTVDPASNPRLWRILKAHAELAGQPFLINTSLNAQGHPIASSARNVLDDFMKRDVDAFVFDDVMAFRAD